jgi:hypothetical protein
VLWFHMILMTRFLFCATCFLVPPPLPVPFFALALRRRLVAVADALLGMIDIDFLLLPCPAIVSAAQGPQACPMLQQVYGDPNGDAGHKMHYFLQSRPILVDATLKSWHEHCQVSTLPSLLCAYCLSPFPLSGSSSL